FFSPKTRFQSIAALMACAGVCWSLYASCAAFLGAPWIVLALSICGYVLAVPYRQRAMNKLSQRAIVIMWLASASLYGLWLILGVAVIVQEGKWPISPTDGLIGSWWILATAVSLIGFKYDRADLQRPTPS